MTTAEILEKFPIFLSHHIDKKFDKAVLLHLEYQYLTITNPCYGNSKSSVGAQQKGLFLARSLRCGVIKARSVDAEKERKN